VPSSTIGNIAQNGIKNKYRNHPTPRVEIPIMVNNPKIPKINTLIRMRAATDISGLSKSEKLEYPEELSVLSKLWFSGTSLPSWKSQCP